jgi:hypothetical protein
LKPASGRQPPELVCYLVGHVQPLQTLRKTPPADKQTTKTTTNIKRNSKKRNKKFYKF